eukprot:1460629-Prymnesium_polylepis.1
MSVGSCSWSTLIVVYVASGLGMCRASAGVVFGTLHAIQHLSTVSRVYGPEPCALGRSIKHHRGCLSHSKLVHTAPYLDGRSARRRHAAMRSMRRSCSVKTHRRHAPLNS